VSDQPFGQMRRGIPGETGEELRHDR
jgi:hypothetical protein